MEMGEKDWLVINRSRRKKAQKNRQGHSVRTIKNDTHALFLVFLPCFSLSQVKNLGSAPDTLFLKRARNASALGSWLFHLPQDHPHMIT